MFGSSSQVKVVWLRFYLAQVFGSSSQVKVVWLKLFGSYKCLAQLAVVWLKCLAHGQVWKYQRKDSEV